MPYPGSTDTLTLTVDPYDGTTSATVVVTPPTGTPLTPAVVTTDGGHTWTGHPVYPVAGKWIAHWTVTGTGAGVTEQEIWVSAPASPAAAVAWRPERWHVADQIPGRTLVGAADGYGNPLYTFDDTSTHPRGSTVDRLVTEACAWVLMKTGTVDASLYDAARGVAALHVAAKVELGYPDRADDLNTAQQLYQQAVAARDDLWRANIAVTGTDVEDPAAHLLPAYAFPAPVSFGDLEFE